MAGRNWRELTDQELKREAAFIATASGSAEEVGRKLKEKLDYPYGVAVCYNGEAFIGMMYGKDGNVISF